MSVPCSCGMRGRCVPERKTGAETEYCSQEVSGKEWVKTGWRHRQGNKWKTWHFLVRQWTGQKRSGWWVWWGGEKEAAICIAWHRAGGLKILSSLTPAGHIQIHLSLYKLGWNRVGTALLSKAWKIPFYHMSRDDLERFYAFSLILDYRWTRSLPASYISKPHFRRKAEILWLSDLGTKGWLGMLQSWMEGTTIWTGSSGREENLQHVLNLIHSCRHVSWSCLWKYLALTSQANLESKACSVSSTAVLKAPILNPHSITTLWSHMYTF